MDRRELLAMLVAGLATAAWDKGAAPKVFSIDNEDRWASLVIDLESAAGVGSAFLAEYPEENDEAHLWRSLALSPERNPRFRDAFFEKRRLDFARGHTVTVDGWVLARSEAVLCALIFMTEGVDRV